MSVCDVEDNHDLTRWISVSILVLMDVGLRYTVNTHEVSEIYDVSILVLMDVGLR